MFRSDRAPVEVGAGVRASILGKRGCRPGWIVLSLESLSATNDNCPVVEGGGANKPANHLFMCAEMNLADGESNKKKKCRRLESELRAHLATNESLHCAKGVVYLYAPGGIGRSKIAQCLPKLLPAPVTARNMRSCVALRDLAEELG